MTPCSIEGAGSECTATRLGVTPSGSTRRRLPGRGAGSSSRRTPSAEVVTSRHLRCGKRAHTWIHRRQEQSDSSSWIATASAARNGSMALAKTMPRPHLQH